MDYIMDFRPALKRAEIPDLDIPKDLADELIKKYEKIADIIYKFGTNKHLTYDEEHYPRVYFEDLQVGNRLYSYESVDGYMGSDHYWVEIEITHIYNRFIFYNVVNPPTDDKRWLEEKWAAKGSIAFLREMYPKKIIICGDWEVECNCPLTKIDVDENMDNKYSSIFENIPERRY